MNSKKRNDRLYDLIIEALAEFVEVDERVQQQTRFFIEALTDDNQFNSLEKVLEWLERRKRECPFDVQPIHLNQVKGWHADGETGDIGHDTGEFFRVIGVRINTDIREVGKGGWDQPMIDQGTKSSLVGLLKHYINGIPHYLIEAKAEPGNYGTLQLSPTLQVTFSNLNRAHAGKKP